MTAWFKFVTQKNFAYLGSGFYLNDIIEQGIALGYFKRCGILVRKRKSIGRGNYVFLTILYNLNLLSKIFLLTLGRDFI